jgi:PAS domain S-box-containing protein
MTAGPGAGEPRDDGGPSTGEGLPSPHSARRAPGPSSWRELSGSGLEGQAAGILRSTFDRSPTGMSVSALDGAWLEINEAYCRMLGYDRSELLGRADRDVTHPDDVGPDTEFIAAALAGRAETLEREKRYVAKDGSVVWAHIREEVIRDEAGHSLYFVSHVQDASERRAAQQLFENSERTLRAVIDNTPAMISVKGRDHRYKLVNREFEQYFGADSAAIIGRSDADLLAPSTVEAVRAKDLLVLDSGVRTQDGETVERDGRQRVILNTRFPLRDEHGEIHGVCMASTDITDHRAEERLTRERLECSELIYSALAQSRFVLHGQPIVHLGSGQPAKLELLIRMRKTRGGDELLAPGTFLPAAERFDLIAAIDEWSVQRAVKLAAAGRWVTVNVSAKTISDAAQVDRIKAAVIGSGAPPENLVFELAETAVVDNLDAAKAFAEVMRELGCAIALDDFGVGHGSFTYLRRLPIDYLKIDLKFVQDLLSDEKDRQVVEAIIGVARHFGIETIAEGVEDQATLDELRRLGVDFGQGYWIGRPGPLPGAPDAAGRSRWVHA